ncbi:MAG TPA: hypothetical protein VJ846_11720 [Sphingomicrobium sp.]|nr:hypothetical protein [Sphingomicrobium sp.]
MALGGCQATHEPCLNSQRTKAISKPAGKAAMGPIVSSDGKRPKTIEDLIEDVLRRSDACKSAAVYNDGEWAHCDYKAIAEYDSLIPKTPANKNLDQLFDMISGTMEIEIWGEGAPVAMKTVSGTLAEFAQARAAILNHSLPPVQKRVGGLDPGARLAWMDDQRLARKARHLWNSIRDRDCKAYPVPYCAERLDNAFSEVIDSEAVEGHAYLKGIF